MTIYDMVPGHLRAGGPLRVRELEGSSKKEGPKEAALVERADKVEISEEGRVLASRSQMAGEAGGDLPPERLGEIQGRMEDGTYDSPEVALEVARIIFESGELDL